MAKRRRLRMTRRTKLAAMPEMPSRSRIASSALCWSAAEKTGLRTRRSRSALPAMSASSLEGIEPPPRSGGRPGRGRRGRTHNGRRRRKRVCRPVPKSVTSCRRPVMCGEAVPAPPTQEFVMFPLRDQGRGPVRPQRPALPNIRLFGAQPAGTAADEEFGNAGSGCARGRWPGERQGGKSLENWALSLDLPNLSDRIGFVTCQRTRTSLGCPTALA